MEVSLDYLWSSPRHRWADFLNSDSYDYRGTGRREDRIENDEWLSVFLRLCGYGKEDLPEAGERAALRQFRMVLARFVAALIAGETPSGRMLGALNKYLRYAESRPIIGRGAEGYKIEKLPSQGGIERIIGYLALNFAETLSDGDVTRIKICENPDCHWVIYDESKNRSRRWCEASSCGNLMKVREFRARRASVREGR